MTLSVLDMIIVKSAVMTSWVLILKIHCMLSANQKRVKEFNVLITILLDEVEQNIVICQWRADQ